MKKIIKALMFIGIFCLLFYNVFYVLWFDRGALVQFYHEPKNSIDIVYVGASNVYTQFNTTLAYNKYGFTTGSITTSDQPFPAIKYMMKEALKYQKPKLFVIDIFQIVHEGKHYSEGDIRKVTDNMRFSKDRTELVNLLLDYTGMMDRKPVYNDKGEIVKEAPNQDYYSYLFSNLLYHNRWKEIKDVNFTGLYIYYKGYRLATKITKQEAFVWNNEATLPLAEENAQALDDLIKYINDNNLNVLFVVPKRPFYEGMNERLNTAINILENDGFKVLNLNNVDEYDIDFNHDINDDAHTNVYGAIKYTLYFSKYLKDNYDLPDHRGDKKYQSWVDEYERMQKDFEEQVGSPFTKWLKEYGG